MIDYAGIVFVGLGASGLTLATSWGGSTYAWSSPVIIGLFAGSAAGAGRLRLGGNPRGRTDPADPAVPQPGVRGLLRAVVHRRLRDARGADVPADVHAIRRRGLGDGVGPADPADGGGHADHVHGQRRHREPHRHGTRSSPSSGTAIMAVGFVLLSRMDAATPMIAAVGVPVHPRHRDRACACRCSS